MTHSAKSGDTIDLYTTLPWASVCEEVAKMKVRATAGNVVKLSVVTGQGEVTG